MTLLRKRIPLLILVLGLLVSAPTYLLAQSTDCDATLSSGDDVALAVTDAPSGDVICLESGDFETNLFIGKSLTLRGDAEGRTVLQSATAGKAVIRTFHEGDPIIVNLEHLILRGAIPLNDETECFDENNCPDGLQLTGSISASLIDVQTLDNYDDGIQVLGGQLRLDGVISKGNRESGLIAQGFTDFGGAVVTIINSLFVENMGDSVLLLGPNEVLIEDSEINQNGQDGLSIIGGPGPKVSVRRTDINNNGFDGIRFVDTAEAASFESVRVTGNGTRPECNEEGNICNGITLNGSGTVSINDSQFDENNGWGLMAWLIKCGTEEDQFDITLSLSNTTFDDNKLGKSCLP